MAFEATMAGGVVRPPSGALTTSSVASEALRDEIRDLGRRESRLALTATVSVSPRRAASAISDTMLLALADRSCRSIRTAPPCCLARSASSAAGRACNPWGVRRTAVRVTVSRRHRVRARFATLFPASPFNARSGSPTATERPCTRSAMAYRVGIHHDHQREEAARSLGQEVHVEHDQRVTRADRLAGTGHGRETLAAQAHGIDPDVQQQPPRRRDNGRCTHGERRAARRRRRRKVLGAPTTWDRWRFHRPPFFRERRIGDFLQGRRPPADTGAASWSVVMVPLSAATTPRKGRPACCRGREPAPYPPRSGSGRPGRARRA